MFDDVYNCCFPLNNRTLIVTVRNRIPPSIKQFSNLEMRNSLPLTTGAASSSASSSSQHSSSHTEGPFKPFLLNPFVGSGVTSPTFSSATRQLPQSPSHSSTYPFPLLYPPYFQQQQQTPNSNPNGTSFSPNGQPPFLVPGSTHHPVSASPSSLSLNVKKDNNETPTDLSKTLKNEQSTSNGLKRKSPVIEDSLSVPSPSSVPSSSSASTSSFRAPENTDPKILSGSRKHRILKPPNINIQEYPNGGGASSNFLNSPMFTPQFNAVPNSPFTFGLDHIPLSAPPIPSQPVASSGRCFDFSSSETFGQHAQFASSKDLTNRNVSSHSNHRSTNFPPSIMKENKLGAAKKAPSDSRVTFQVPATPVNNSTSQNGSNSEQANSSKNKNRYWGSQYPNYQRGTEVLLGNGSLKPIEQLSIQDFAVEDENVKMQLAEIANVIEKKKGIIRIGFIIGQNRFKYSVDMPIEHPFFVYQKGWSSYSPEVTRKRYGLKCGLLTKGDTVVTVTNKVNMKPSKNRAGSTGSLSSGSLSSSTSSLSSTTGTCQATLATTSTSSGKQTLTSKALSSTTNSRDDDDDVEIDVENE